MSSSREPQYITLQEWAARKFSKVPHRNTLLRWVADGMIAPAPFKVGREYMVTPDARHVDEPKPGRTLKDRLRHGVTTA